jgi:hypothetical protein
VICALESSRSSWTAPLDVPRPAPGDDAATVTAGQTRELSERLITAGQWQGGDPEILIVVDAGYDVPRPVFLLKRSKGGWARSKESTSRFSSCVRSASRPCGLSSLDARSTSASPPSRLTPDPIRVRRPCNTAAHVFRRSQS